MYPAFATRRLALGLATVLSLGGAMHAQSQNLEQLKTTDPHGFVLTLTAVSVVFSALALLIVFFKGIGRLMQYLSERHKRKQAEASECPPVASTRPTPEVLVAISLALQSSRIEGIPEEEVACIALSLADHLSGQHDRESYKLTIRHRASQWNNRQAGLRQYPY